MIHVLEGGRPCAFDIEDMMRYHGSANRGGVAHAYKVMQCAFPLLARGSPVEREHIRVFTSFPAPGARDAFEMVTRAATGNRYSIDPNIAADFEAAGYRRSFVFHVCHKDTIATLILRAGHARGDFLSLAAKAHRNDDEEAYFAFLSEEMAARILGLHPREVYEIVQS